MATARPTAVVSSASAIPAETRGETAAALGGIGHLLERGDDAEHRAEQTDERRRRGDGRQRPGSPRRRLASSRSLTRSIERLTPSTTISSSAGSVALGPSAFHPSHEFVDAGADDLGHRAAPEALLEAHRLAQPTGGGHQRLKRADVADRLQPALAEGQEPLDGDADRVHRHDEQDDDHAFGHPTHLVPESYQRKIHGPFSPLSFAPAREPASFRPSCSRPSESVLIAEPIPSAAPGNRTAPDGR